MRDYRKRDRGIGPANPNTPKLNCTSNGQIQIAGVQCGGVVDRQFTDRGAGHAGTYGGNNAGREDFSRAVNIRRRKIQNLRGKDRTVRLQRADYGDKLSSSKGCQIWDSSMGDIDGLAQYVCICRTRVGQRTDYQQLDAEALLQAID
jgi:hypothetical protein